MSLSKLGDVLVAAGDLGGARERFTQSLAIREKLAQANPASAEAQRDVSLSFNRLGDVLVAAGDLGGARERFTQSLAIREKLAQANRASAEAQWDLVVSYVRMAEATKQESWWPKALAVAEELQRTGRLAPSDAQWLPFLRKRVAKTEAPP
ncbi:MAG: tetratricopeptide repeat protein [Bryobacteraceae bacterium]|nr:tetratricopeptide repeat protein [Bryobacteraceae bacterium]